METESDWVAGRLLHGDYRSVVNTITEEYLLAMEQYRPHGYEFTILSSFQICLSSLRERFMAVDQRNYLFHKGELERFKNSECRRCQYETPEISCDQSVAEIEKCFERAEARRWADLAAPSWELD